VTRKALRFLLWLAGWYCIILPSTFWSLLGGVALVITSMNYVRVSMEEEAHRES
jgi:hypothetical protein